MVKNVIAPGTIIKIDHSPPNHDETFVIEAMVLDAKIEKDGSPRYSVSTPDAPDSEIPDGEPHPIHGRTEKYRMTGGSLPGVTPDEFADPGDEPRHRYDRARRRRRMEKAGNEDWS